MAPNMDDASPNGDGNPALAAIGNRLTPSASAPLIGNRKGVSIMIDPMAPMRDGVSDDTDTLFLSQSPPVMERASSHQKVPAGGKTAWCSSPASGSRPGSRQSAGPMGSRFSSCSLGSSSRQHSTSGRFTQEELICFKRVPTPSSSCEFKRDNYWEQGGSGELRKKLAFDHWNTLPVLKGKFYQHPRLSDSVNHLSVEKARDKKTHQKRQNQLHNQRAENLPDEALTAALLDEIYPKTLFSFPGGRDRFDSAWSSAVGFETPCGGDASPSTPSAEGMRKFNKQKSAMSTPAAVNKRLSATDFLLGPSVGGRERLDSAMPEAERPRAQTEGAAVLNASGSATNFGNSAALGSTGATTISKQALDAAGRRDTLLEFRKQIFLRYATIKEGFDSFDREFPGKHEMTKKEWRRVLTKLGFDASVEERDAIFDQLDFNANGHVSMMEFHVAIEAAAPVRTMEDLRRRWLAAGYTSMAQAFSLMSQDEGITNKRLLLREFGELLSRVHVVDHAEHVALFNAIADQNESTRTVKVSIGELAAALATVSPSAYLEEIRQRLLKRYNGIPEKAFWDIDQDHSGIVSRGEFKNRTVFRMGLTESEAAKMFDTIDFDDNGSISLSEFLCALSMSEPSLFHEDLRKKIRQRFRSICDAFTHAMEDFTNADLAQNPKLQFQRFELLLKDMELTHEELRTLFDLIDANKDGALTIKEFIQGMQYFAPSCVLEDLRLLCLQKHPNIPSVFEAFAEIGIDRQQLMDLERFKEVLEKEGLTDGVEVDRVFALLDMRNEGVVTLGKLTAALQSGGPGNRKRQPSEERDKEATQDVRYVMSAHHKYAADLKMSVRHGLHTPEAGLNRQSSGDSGRGDSQQEASTTDSPNRSTEIPGGHRPSGAFAGRARHHRKSEGFAVAFKAQAWSTTARDNDRKKAGQEAKTAQTSTLLPHQKESVPAAATGSVDVKTEAMQDDEEIHKAMEGKVAPPIRTLPQEELAKYMARLDPSRVQEHKKIAQDPITGSQQSWGRLWKCLHGSPDAQERLEVEKELLQYYQKATKTASHDVPLLERSHSRHAAHRSAGAHRRALAQQGNWVPRS